MSNTIGTLGWVQGMGEIFIPEKRFTNIPEQHYSLPILGSAHTIAIFNDKDACVGWYEAETFSSKAVKVDAIKDKLNHGCDGPITPFVLISRAIALAKTENQQADTIANALDELLTEYGWLKDGLEETGS